MPIFVKWRQISALAFIFFSGMSGAQVPFAALSSQTPALPFWNSGSSSALQSQPALLAERSNDPRKSIHLWPSSLSYSRETNFMDFNVSNDLNFGVDYTYSFTVNLGARRSNGDESQVPNGWYKLNMAVVLKATDSIFRPAMGLKQVSPYDRYVTSVSMFVKVSGGRFNRSVTMKFPNVTATTLINHLFVELVPLRKDCRRPTGGGTFPCITLTADGRQPDPANSIIEPLPGVKPYLIEMPFVPYLSKDRSDRNPDDAPESETLFLTQSLDQYIAAARLYQQRTRPAPENPEPPEHARRNHLHFFNLGDAALQRLAREWLPDADADAAGMIRALLARQGLGTLDLSDDFKKLMPVLCDLLFENNSQYQSVVARSPIKVITRKAVKGRVRQCGLDPESYLTLSRVTHVHKVNQQKPSERLFSRGMSFNLMANFMVNRMRSEDFSSGWTFKPQAIFLQALEAFGLPIPPVADWSYSITTVHGRSASENMIGSLLTSLDFNINAMNIPVALGTQCLQVMPKADEANTFVDTREGAMNGLYICDDERRDFQVQESFAHIFDRGRETSTVDAYDPLSQSINLGLRGDRDISTFFYLIRKNITPKHDSKILPFKSLEKVESHFHSVPKSLPRLVVHPLTFERDEAPSFMQKLFGGYSEAFMGQ